MMKKIARLLSLALIMVMVTGIIPVKAASVKLNKKRATLEIGASISLKLTGAEGKVTWKSSDKKIASVSKKGKVTAKAEGTATITATCGTEKYTCKVTVVDSNKELSEDVTVKNPETSAKEYTFELVSFEHSATIEMETYKKVAQTAPDGYEYAVFTVKTTNISKSYTNLPSYDFYVDKKKFNKDVRIGLYNGYDWFFGAIASGMESTNYIILEVPVDWKSLDLYFLTDYGASKSAISVTR